MINAEPSAARQAQPIKKFSPPWIRRGQGVVGLLQFVKFIKFIK